MNRILIALAAFGIAASAAFGQTNNPPATNAQTRPVSAAVTNAVNALAGVPAPGVPPGVGQSAGQLVNALYQYAATNGVISAGLGNTLDKLLDKSANGKARVSLKALTTENVKLPAMIPTNNVVTVNVELVASQLYAADKTHLGLGLGLDTLWHVGWLHKVLNVGPFQNLEGIDLCVFGSPDVDKTINLQFARKYTVVGFEGGLKFII